MSQLIIDELFDGVTFSQNIHITKSIAVAFIRPWIYKQGTIADGKLRLEVYDGATLLKRADIPHALINNNIPGTYAHGYIRFNTAPLALNVADNETEHIYTLKFSMVDHTSNPSNYIAICREWDQHKYPIYGTPSTSDLEEPAGYELYVYDRG